MIGVVAHFLKVVVLAADAQTLLRVGNTPPLGVLVAQDNILELVHTRIGKHERGVILDNHGSRRHDMVAMLLKIALESLSNFFCCKHNTYLNLL